MSPNRNRKPAAERPGGGERPGGDDEGRLDRLVANAEPVVGRVASAAGTAVRAAKRGWDERPGARIRHLRRLARDPLPQLYEVHPEARQANPREVGLRSVPLDEIRGSAVGGINQRGGDFLPLKPFRSVNWAGRWQRIRNAIDRLAILPPIDVLRYGDGYWVVDGHNRVAAALYTGQVEIDANVTELVPLGAHPRERPGSLATALIGSQELRSAGAGRMPATSLTAPAAEFRWGEAGAEAERERTGNAGGTATTDEEPATTPDDADDDPGAGRAEAGPPT